MFLPKIGTHGTLVVLIKIKGIDPIITPNLSQKLFFAEKVFSGMKEMCPKILRGYEY